MPINFVSWSHSQSGSAFLTLFLDELKTALPLMGLFWNEKLLLPNGGFYFDPAWTGFGVFYKT